MGVIAGVSVGRTIAQRQILFDPALKMEFGGIMASDAVDGSNTGYTDRIRGGWLLGLKTSTKEWYPLKRTLVNGASESSSIAGDYTRFTVDNAAAFAVGDVITVGSNTNLAITAINYTTNRITVDDAINVGDNDAVFAENGSGTARGILLDDEVWLRNEDNTAAADKAIRVLVFGAVKSSMVLGDLTAALAATNYLSKIIFDTDHGF